MWMDNVVVLLISNSGGTFTRLLELIHYSSIQLVMSSFSDQMERGNSTQTLSSRASSEQMESGIYITPYATAMFIAAMLTVGVLFITIVATLTVMLQSCQNRNPGVVQLGVRSDEYNYCKMFILHAELNRLEVDEFPSICKTRAIQYFKEGTDQYLRDLNWTIWVINNSYLNSLKPEADGLDVVLLDLDDILNVLVDKHQAGAHILELYTKLQASGWSSIFIARNPEKLHNVTMGTLISSGYRTWSSLIMRCCV